MGKQDSNNKHLYPSAATGENLYYTIRKKKRYQSEMHHCTALTGAQNECIHHLLFASQMEKIFKVGPKMVSFAPMMHGAFKVRVYQCSASMHHRNEQCVCFQRNKAQLYSVQQNTTVCTLAVVWLSVLGIISLIIKLRTDLALWNRIYSSIFNSWFVLIDHRSRPYLNTIL